VAGLAAKTAGMAAAPAPRPMAMRILLTSIRSCSGNHPPARATSARESTSETGSRHRTRATGAARCSPATLPASRRAASTTCAFPSDGAATRRPARMLCPALPSRRHRRRVLARHSQLRSRARTLSNNTAAHSGRRQAVGHASRPATDGHISTDGGCWFNGDDQPPVRTNRHGDVVRGKPIEDQEPLFGATGAGDKVDLLEGACTRTNGDACERNPKARRLCLAHHGR
jgi:hypothetical protein